MHRLSLILLVTCFMVVASVSTAVTARLSANPDLVAEVEAGTRHEAMASWWGFDEADATRYLQAAIDSGVRKLVVPNMGVPWTVEPIFLAGNQEIVFAEGVVVQAKEGAFHGRNDCLFEARNQENIVIRGYGAVWRMRKADYAEEPYEAAEWRHTLGLYGCRNITIEGLYIEKSGGDGIYIGRGGWGVTGTRDEEAEIRNYCKDIVVRDVVIDRHYRQGISIISVENMLIENTVLKNTGMPEEVRRTPPAAGIDIEPNSRAERLVNIVIRNSVIEGNRRGFMLYSPKTEHPISILVENTHIGGGGHGQYNGIDIAAVQEGTRGVLEFRNVTVEGSLHNGARIRDKSDGGLQVIFRDCVFRNNGLEEYELWGHQISLPILFMGGQDRYDSMGGVQFINCLVQDNHDRPFLLAIRDEGQYAEGLRDVKGQFRVMNPQRTEIEIDMPRNNVFFDVNGVSK